MKIKINLSKYFIPFFYTVAILVMVLFQWNEQVNIRKGGTSPLYRNFMDSPAFIKKGFNPQDLLTVPEPQSQNEWVQFVEPPLRIVNSNLPDLPKRVFLSPFGKPAQEFTLVIPIQLDTKAIDILDGDIQAGRPAVIPGLYFGYIGENWEIYFNGELVRREMHLDSNGKIKSRRNWRDVYFPLDKHMLNHGTNILAIRIIGDPTFGVSGFYYNAPYYLDEYQDIEKRNQSYLLLFLCGVFGYTGIYYLLIFISIRKKREMFNFFYGIFSILLCVYAIMGNGLVNNIIPNSDIQIRLEYISIFLAIPILCLFIEHQGRKKTTLVSRIFMIFSSFLAVTQTFFCAQYGDDVLMVWGILVLVYFSYVFMYDIIYYFFWDVKRNKRDAENRDMFISIMIGSFIVYACGIYDILDVVFFQNSIRLFVYSTFVFHIGMAFTLSKRLRGILKRLEHSNTRLELSIQERTQDLEQQTAIAIQASRAKSQFLATMSHEIRTPLNAVIGLSEIELAGNLSDKSRNNIRNIYQSGASLLGIINDILDISKIEAGGFELVPTEYDTASFISDTVNLNRVRIGSKPISFKLEISADFPQQLTGDELRVKQILNNILSNAIKYTDEGSVTLEITHSKISQMESLDYYDEETGEEEEALAQEVLIRFKVHDTGIGIREKDLEKLFTSYIQLDSRANRRIDGTGLGLVIAKNITEMMCGNISVESVYGQGSTFTIEFIQVINSNTPIGEETAQSLRDFVYSKFSNGKSVTRSWMPNANILVVDDMPVNLQVAIGLLEPYGIQADTVLSGKEAIEKIKSQNYDLVFMDHMMPEMDGIETVKLIRQWEKETKSMEFSQKTPKLSEAGLPTEAQLPIVALTANALVGSADMFLSRGFNGFISKPIDIRHLNEALIKWIPKEKIQIKPQDEKDTVLSSTLSPINIHGVDTQHGIMMTGGTVNGYLKVLSMFCNDAMQRMSVLNAVPDKELLPVFITQVHALKSALGTMGAAQLSKNAADLEAAGKDANTAFIKLNLDSFRENLAQLVKDISASIQEEAGEAQEASNDNSALFEKLKTALKTGDAFEVDSILEEFGSLSLDSKTRQLIENISMEVLKTEYNNAIKLIEGK